MKIIHLPNLVDTLIQSIIEYLDTFSDIWSVYENNE
jgi:hypothetical protein